jgi:recombinational DNA repair ATPase RecF
VKTGGSHNFELPAHLEDKVRSISRQQKTPMIAVVRAAVWLLKDNITHEAIIALDDMACTPEENNQ